MLSSIPIIFAFAGCILMFACLGTGLCRALKLWNGALQEAYNFWMRIFFVLSLGLSAVMIMLVTLAFLNIFRPTVIFGVLGVLTFMTALALLPCARRWEFSTSTWLVCGAFLLTCGAFLPISIHLPGHWDDTMYHLVLSRVYLEQGSTALYPYVRFPLFPQNMEVLFALGLALFGPNTTNGEILAQMLATFPLVLTIIGLLGLSQWKTHSIVPGIAAACGVLLFPSLQQTLGYAYVDAGLMLFCFGLTLAILQAFAVQEAVRMRWLFVAGVLAAMACGTKFFGLAYVFFAGVMLCVTMRTVRAALVYGITTLVLGAAWYARAWIISGDPFHPLGGPYFGYFLWSEWDLEMQKLEQASHGVHKSLFYLWPALKSVGAEMLAFTPMALLHRARFGPGLVFITGVVLAYFLLWLYATQVARYLMPLLPSALFLGAFGIWQSCMCFFPRIKVLLTAQNAFNKFVVFLLPALLAVIMTQSPRLQNRISSLEQIQGGTLMRKASELLPAYGDKVIQIGFENAVYFFKGRTLGDHFGSLPYTSVIEAPLPHTLKAYTDLLNRATAKLIPAAAMLQLMHKEKCAMLIINTQCFYLDLKDYEKLFTIQMKTPHGMLLTVSESSAPIKSTQ